MIVGLGNANRNGVIMSVQNRRPYTVTDRLPYRRIEMETDKEIALRGQALRDRARDVHLIQLPGYMQWSERKLSEGVSPALIENLDSRTMFLLPEEDQSIGVDDYEELFADLIDELGE